jgi:hypothetical protein
VLYEVSKYDNCKELNKAMSGISHRSSDMFMLICGHF